MTNVIDRETIDFILFDVLKAEMVCTQGRFAIHDRSSLSAVLDLAEKISSDHLWPHAELADSQEPRLVDGQVHILPAAIDALNVLRTAGFFAARADVELGGMQLPACVSNAIDGILKAGNPSTHPYLSLTRAAANLLTKFGDEQQKTLLRDPMLNGRFFGTMCLSEPNAGSSLVDIKTRAEPINDRRYSITGSKMWISGGDHDASENIVHLVLARVPGSPAGVKGISLFAVPKYRVLADGTCGEPNHVCVAGLNHKMGLRGISNCLLAFGEKGPCEGTLVGKQNEGLVAMFQMMNEARIAVGIGGAMIASAAYRFAVGYARERKQGRKLGDKKPSFDPVPIIEHPDVRRMLLRQKSYSEGAIALCLYAGQVVDRIEICVDELERRRLENVLDILTPIVKAWPSEFGLEANKLAMQVLGGYGYARDFPVERLYRDNRLNMIHEGTNGIQALDLLGRKATRNDGEAFDALCEEMRPAIRSATEVSELRPYARKLSALLDEARNWVTAVTKKLSEGNAEDALAFAYPFLNAMGHISVGWMWLLQAISAEYACRAAGFTNSFHEGKRRACQYFFEVELPEAECWLRVSTCDPGLITRFPNEGF